MGKVSPVGQWGQANVRTSQPDSYIQPCVERRAALVCCDFAFTSATRLRRHAGIPRARLGRAWESRRWLLARFQRSLLRRSTKAVADRARCHLASHGHWLGLTHGSRNGHGTHRIELTHPGMGARLIADRTTLLHEMIHQALVEQGVNPHHDKEPWRAEITRLHAVLTGGERLWCAFDQVRKVNGRSVRVPAPAPEPNMLKIEQKDIARWQRRVGLRLVVF